jgi:tRNA (guanine37-N1)-methyltransferase
LIKFYVLTLFKDFFESFKNTSIVKKGLEKCLYDILVHDIRENALNRYGQVDDIPYGGGAGMLLRPEPVYKTYESLNLPENDKKKVIFFSPKGKKIDHNYIINLTNFENIVLICGHYEGMDQRIIDSLVDEELSIGDFVLTGGEIPAMALIDSTVRQIEGVIKKDSLKDESFTSDFLEHRQYTRPPDFMGMKVPEVLYSGNHKEIEKYKLEDSIRETIKKRHDLIDGKVFSNEINNIIRKIEKETNDEFGRQD